ncbi:MAG: hypothetical protein D4R64_15675 [Porphyromonadaceae bacterium]|nr:MAG: hypothetical protein D4R64_15675 [Porphyromonadaceae bacterium]
MDWKTEQEWIVMRYFTENCPGFPKGKLVKGESPDFQLWISPKRFIGIELTQVRQFNTDNPVQGYLVHEIAIKQVNESIRAKEEKIRLYRLDHPYKVWLIIFADYSEQDALEKVTHEYEHNGIETSFDKIFFFNLDTHQACQLT